ncbi:GDSL esterase/lipase At5g14450-like [Pyrus communis]|uniref:GDSL esterase/lipase At5g14450-like n=1 Tax=Pyrus communis TaxID=23211 RepID=UPI0035BFB5B5
MFGVVKMEMARFFAVGFFAMCLLSVGGERVTYTSSGCDFPAIYNFGDSNSDTGANSAAFYPMASPCGETFFHRPAGRGCDGRLIIDFIAKHLGLPYLSPYLDSLESNFRHGANFASGGATIRRYNESMSENGVSPFYLDIQIAQYTQFKSRTTSLSSQAEEQSDRFPIVDDFARALCTFDIGQNDLAAGFRKKFSSEQFEAQITDMINQQANAVRNLYEQGARTFWIHNTGPIGCLAVTLHNIHSLSPGLVDGQGCDKFQNDMARQFNRQLEQKVIQLRKELPLSAITYVDVFAAKYELIGNATKHGFLDKANICCGYHEHDDHVWCGNKGIISNGTQVYAGSCEDPSLYISWDGVHYTEAANRWIADQIVGGSFSDVPVPITDSCHRIRSE